MGMVCSVCDEDRPRREFRFYLRGRKRTVISQVCVGCRKVDRKRRRERRERFLSGRQTVHDRAYDDGLGTRLRHTVLS